MNSEKRLSNEFEISKPIIIGVAGYWGSGRTEAASKLSELAGGANVKVGDVARKKAEERGLDTTNKTVAEIRNMLQDAVGSRTVAGYCIPFIKGEERNLPDAVIVDGVRGTADVRALRQEFGLTFFLLSVEASQNVRNDWISERRGVDDHTDKFEVVQEEDKKEIKQAMEVARYRIENKGSLEELEKETVEVYRKIMLSVTKCSLCKRRVPQEKLAKHQASNNCVYWRREKLLEGMDPVPNSTVRDCLREKGVNLVKGLTGPRTKETAWLGWYAPKEEIEKLEGKILDPYEYARNAVKVCQDENFIAVRFSPLRSKPSVKPLDQGDLDRSGPLVPFRKDEPGRTRKRKFKVQGGKLYTRKGRRIGERVSNDEVGKDLRVDMDGRRLRGS